MSKYKKETLSITAAMEKLIAKVKAMEEKDIVIPGNPITFSDFFIDAIKKTGIDESTFQFYYYSFYPEQLEGMPVIELEFDYIGRARKLHEIKNWHEIEAATARLICDSYILEKQSSNFKREKEKCKVKIGYIIQQNSIYEDDTLAKEGMEVEVEIPMPIKSDKKEKKDKKILSKIKPVIGGE